MVYAYTGAMMGQLVHLGVIQGYALLPWALLVMLAMARAVERAKDVSWGRRLGSCTGHHRARRTVGPDGAHG